MPVPRVAIIGRPNVGKSSLVNMIARERVAIVDDQPGVTRDRLSVLVDLENPDREGPPQTIELTDTGGYGVYVAEGARYDEIGADLGSLTDDIEHQIAEAVRSADLILFCIDTHAGITPRDHEIAKLLREQKYARLDHGRGPRHEVDPDRRVPVRVVATKVDGPSWEVHAYEFSALGFEEPLMCSATSKYMRRQMLDDLFEIVAGIIAERPEEFVPEETIGRADLKIAIVGKRNSGKSTLVNHLAGEDRVIVSEIAGTTRDAIDVKIDLPDGRSIVAIDTAGLRRKKSFQGRVEWYAFDRSRRAIDRADVVLLMVDATAEISQVDEQLAKIIVDSFKPVIVVVNKWDLAEGQPNPSGRPVGIEDYERYVHKELAGLAFAPIAFMSAKEGLNVDGVLELAFEMREQAATRVGTGELNRTIRGIIEHRGPSSKLGTIARVYYVSQVATTPPTLVLIVNQPQLFFNNYERYLMNRIRERLPFQEVPVKLIFREKKRAEKALASRRKDLDRASRGTIGRRQVLHTTAEDGSFETDFAFAFGPGVDLDDEATTGEIDRLLMQMPDDAEAYFDD